MPIHKLPFQTPPPPSLEPPPGTDPNANQGAQGPAQAPKPVDVPLPPPEAKPEQKAENKANKEQKAAEQAQQAAREQADGNVGADGLRNRAGTGAGAGEETSGFRQDTGELARTKLPDQFGRKINVSPEAARLVQQEAGDGLPPVLQQLVKNSENPEAAERLLAAFRNQLQNPQAMQKDYRAVLTERFFRGGPLKDSPLCQKLQQQALKQQEVKQALDQPLEKALEKGELGQLFRLRNQAEEKEQFRNVLRNEIAKAKLERMAQQVGGVKSQADKKDGGKGAGRLELGQLSEAERIKQQFAQKLLQQGATSKFEKVLQDVLAGSKKAVPILPDGTKARFAIKTEEEWNVFFQNVANMNSAEVAAEGKLGSLIDALFRGLFTKATTGQKMLVADLAMTEGGEVAENKFSQIAVKDDALAELLEKLTPGDSLPGEVLKQVGKEFEFLKLVNALAIMALTEEQKNEVLKAFRQTHNPDSQRRLEHALIGSRDEAQRRDREALPPPPVVFPSYQPSFVERFRSTPKWFVYLVYGIMGVTSGLILYILYRAFGA